MKIYYLSEERTNGKDAGSKARNDVDDILKKQGFEAIKMLNKDENGKVKTFFMISSFLSQLRNIEKESIIISQYPIYDKSVFMRYYLKTIKKRKNIKHVALVHDLNSLRVQNEEKIIEELKRLEVFDAIISHNPKMTKWLKGRGVRGEIIDLEIFDYLVKDFKKKETKVNDGDFTICFAGNLSKEKSQFIYNLDERLKINLYGPFFSGKDEKRYKGCLKPEELPETLNENFGLIWDGTSTQGCVGEMGEYLQYNNPHKTSLYIASGLPIIIWEKAALADFVLKNNIGITIGSLDELYDKLSAITESEYKVMKENIMAIRADLIKGNFTKRAIEKAVADLN